MIVPAIELEAVSKRYGSDANSTAAINDLSLAVPPGQFLSLMGPSGSGKTTLLNLMAALDVPDAGSVRIGGADLRRMTDRQRSSLRLTTIGFIFQAFNLIPALTVRENVEWPLEYAGHSRAQVRRRVEESLARVGMPNRGERLPAQLSGGEQQRVAIARAIATEPAIILADEPTGHLDSHTGQTILDLLRDLNRSRTVTIVMVTHNLFAANFGHRTLELRDGRLVRDVSAPAEPVVSVVGGHAARR